MNIFQVLQFCPWSSPGQDNAGVIEGFGQDNVGRVSDDPNNEEVPLILGPKWRQLILIICLFCLRTVTVLLNASANPFIAFVGQIQKHC